MNYEVAYGLKMMKYAVNHWWKFKHANVAFLVGLLKVISAVLIALIIYSSIIMMATNVVDLTRDCVALLVIFKLDLLLAYLSQEHLHKSLLTDNNS